MHDSIVPKRLPIHSKGHLQHPLPVRRNSIEGSIDLDTEWSDGAREGVDRFGGIARGGTDLCHGADGVASFVDGVGCGAFGCGDVWVGVVFGGED